MRRALILALGGIILVSLVLWAGGVWDQIGSYAAERQRGFQNSIARTLRALRGGDPGAMMLLMSACFAYGFFHAVGPGHGKILVGGYGLARRVPMLRLSAIALASSLGQAVTAIALAYAGLWLLALTRDQMIGVAERTMAPLSYAAIAAVGIWLFLRGWRRLIRRNAAENHADVGNEDICASCGHSHGPSLRDAEQAGTLREALILIGGIAIRPCTGALFVLIITWQMGIGLAGVAGAFAMALGTASVTIAVGLAASGLRGGVLRGFAGATALAWAVPVFEIAAGGLVVVLAVGLLMQTF